MRVGAGVDRLPAAVTTSRTCIRRSHAGASARWSKITRSPSGKPSRAHPGESLRGPLSNGTELDL